MLQRSEQEPNATRLELRGQDYLGATSGDITRHFRNADPDLHPFERAREYQRALKAVKMEKIFAKPFVKALEGHTDSVKCMAMARRAGAPLLPGLTARLERASEVWELQRRVAPVEHAAAMLGPLREGPRRFRAWRHHEHGWASCVQLRR